MKIIQIRTGTISYSVVFIDVVKDNRFYYFLHFRKTDLYKSTIKKLSKVIDFLNKKIDRIYNFDLLILKGQIFYIYYIYFFSSFSLLEKCKILKEGFIFLGINIMPFLDKSIKNFLIKYWNNYEIEINFIYIDFRNKKDIILDINQVYKITKIENDIIYRRKINKNKIKNKIDNFKKELNIYFKK